MDASQIDIRLKQLSYSSRLLLDSCPRKYQLKKLGADIEYQDTQDELITFEFGKLVGYGIQLVFMGISRENIFLACFEFWILELNTESTRHKKSFWYALIAIDKFIGMRQQGFLADYDILYYNSQPAAELSFLVDFGDGFNERGFLDLVLEHRLTGEVITVELKTDSSKVPIHEAKYQNSTQPLGYSVLLDHIKPGLNSYTVLYIIYLSEKFEYQAFQFTKSIKQKAEWLNSIVMDIERIKLYSSYNFWPKHGQSCLAWNKPCKYFNRCHMSDKLLLRPITKQQELEVLKDNEETYTIKTTARELITGQLARPELKGD
jgi:hypothetical protein